MATKSRIREIDILKGIGIFLMVWGHCGSPIHDFIYLFHMAIFFTVSGFCYNGERNHTICGIGQFLKKRLISLYIPYVCVGGILLSLKNVFWKFHLISGDALPFANIGDFAKDLIKIFSFILGSSNVPFYGATWFIRVLFMSLIIYAIIDFVTYKIFGGGYAQRICISVACLCGLLLSFFLTIKDVQLEICGMELIDKINRPMTSIALIDMGRWLRDWNREAELSNRKAVVAGVVSLILLIGLNQFGSIALNENKFVNPGFLLLSSFLGFVMCYCVSKLMVKYAISKPVEYLGKHTMCIVLLHLFAFTVITALQVYLYDLPLDKRSSFPVLYTTAPWQIAYLFVGIAVPLLLDYVWRRIMAFIKVTYNKRRGKCAV